MSQDTFYGSIDLKWHNDTMSDEANRLGKFLREVREDRDYSQAELAKELSGRLDGKYLHTTIGKIESGKRGISLIEAAHIAKILKINWDRLLDSLSPTTPSSHLSKIANTLHDSFSSLFNAKNLVTNGAFQIKEFQELHQNEDNESSENINEVMERIESDLDELRNIFTSIGTDKDRVFKLYEFYRGHATAVGYDEHLESMGEVEREAWREVGSYDFSPESDDHSEF